MHPKALAGGISTPSVVCEMLDQCLCTNVGEGKLHIWQLFPSLLGLVWER